MKRKNLSVLIFGAGIALATAMASAETLTVSAASSLTDAFKEIGKGFEAAYPGNKVEFNFAASGVLLQQIARGAPVDVFASADQETMDKAAAGNHIKNETRVNFTGNSLVVIVPKDSKLKITGLKDLTNADIKRIVIGNPSTTPNGRYARSAMQAAGVWETVQPKLIFAENVRQSLSYVGRGEVDAGFVFATDAKQDENKVNVALTVPTVVKDEKNGQWTSSPIVYPIAEVAASKNKLGGVFIAYVLSPDGKKVLERYGFLMVQ
ncbi:MAG: molybdate ABC transporter substrate-binding protein [Burkholderiales bacterium]|jgi:molybdate transport system substrate-binding protein|nr:molybdate ABC transporter substrate-binding protein [Burkholderiales bacterium]